MHRILVSVWLTAAVASALAQVPAAELAKPPANARHFVIQSTGGKHGDSWSWVAADGSRMGRESMNLRGQVFELDSSGKAGGDGVPSAITIRGVTPQGDAAETFTIRGGTAGWKSPIDAGTASYSVPAFYVSQGGPIDMTAWFLEALLTRPDKSLDLLPGGKARAAKLVDLEVGTGAATHELTIRSARTLNAARCMDLQSSISVAQCHRRRRSQSPDPEDCAETRENREQREWSNVSKPAAICRERCYEECSGD